MHWAHEDQNKFSMPTPTRATTSTTARRDEYTNFCQVSIWVHIQTDVVIHLESIINTIDSCGWIWNRNWILPCPQAVKTK